MAYKRNCPSCGNEITYSRPQSVERADNKQSICHKCSVIRQTGRKHTKEHYAEPTGFGEIPQWYWRQNKPSREKHGGNITIEEMDAQFKLQNGRCYYTGKPLVFGRNLTKKRTTASIDRIDSSKGYIKGNIQWVHKDVNTMKETLSHSRFVEICREIADYADIVTSIDEFISNQKVEV